MIAKLNMKDKLGALSIIFFLLMTIFYSLLSFSVRPIADDYCAGALSSKGILNYIYEISQNWGGDYSQIIFSALLVGLPLAKFPLFLIGFTTLFISVILLLVVFFKIFLYLSFNEDTSFLKKFAFQGLGLILILWNLFWSLPASLDFGFYFSAFAMTDKSFGAVFGWPTVIVQYLIVPFILFISFFSLLKTNWMKLFLLFIVGFTSGLSGYALAVALIATLILFQLIPRLRMKLLPFIFCGMSLSFGVLLSLFSPGSRSRAKILLSDDLLESKLPFLRWVFISSLEFVTSIFNIGNILILVCSFLFFYSTLRLALKALSLEKLKTILMALGIFLFVYYLSISFSEYFTYEAFWHLITYRSLLFVFVFFLGAFLALKITNVKSNSLNHRQRYLASGTLLCLISSSIFVSWHTNATLFERPTIWANGPAPLPGIGDIEPRDGWVDLCWERLKDVRNFPERI